MSHAKSHGGETGHHGHEAEEEKMTPKDLKKIVEMARAIDSAPDPAEAEKEFQNKIHSLNEAALSTIIEMANDIPLPNYLLTRLRADLRENDTADYSRINLTEVFMAFNYQAEHAITHWRLAKIADAAVTLRDEFKAIQKDNTLYSLGKTNLSDMIFDKVEGGGARNRDYPITVSDPSHPNSAPEKINASLSDIAYFLDILNQNRALGGDKIDKKEILYKYFKGLDNPGVYSLQKEVVSPDGQITQIDLLDTQANPKDDYFHIKVYEYRKRIEKSQGSLYLMSTWQTDTGGHREVSGQAYKNGEFYVPVSGEIAQLITWEDMQKAGETSKNLKGQPQELGDMDEDETGAIIRFRSKYLKQRNVGNSASTYNSSNIRVHKAMFGYTTDDEPEQARTENGKRVIYFGNQDLNAKAIDGIKRHYRKTRKRLNLPEMSDADASKVASDIFLLDVIAPCLLNNTLDWKVGLSKIFKLEGNVTALASKGDDAEFPGGITIKIMCKKRDNPNILVWESFRNVAELKDYIYWRVSLGHVEQDGFIDVQEQMDKDARDAESKRQAKDAKKNKEFNAADGVNYGAVIRQLLGSVGEDYLGKFIGGAKKFPALRAGDGRVLGPADKRGSVALTAILKAELEALDEGAQRDVLEPIFATINTPTEEDEIDEEFESLEDRIAEFIKQINRLSSDAGKSDREKLK